MRRVSGTNFSQNRPGNCLWYQLWRWCLPVTSADPKPAFVKNSVPHTSDPSRSLLHPRASEPLALILTKSQLAELLCCSERHVDNLRRRGLVPSINLGRSVRFRRDAVLSAVRKLEGGCQS